MSPCRFIAKDKPRLRNGHHLRDCKTSGCEGCEPCRPTYGHCRCGRHLDAEHPVACPRCVGFVRDDLADIARLSGRQMAVEALYRGVESEAAMLTGPSAHPADWQRRASWAMLGKVDDAYLEDCRDELHPLWVLGTWEMLWRDHLGHETDQAITIGLAVDYLATQLTYMAQQHEPDFEQFAREVRDCRGHLEDVLHDQRAGETGAPCPMCGKRDLVKDYGDSQTVPCSCGPRPVKPHAEHGRCDCPFRLRLEETLNPATGEVAQVAVRVYDDPLPDGHMHERPDLACIACRAEQEWETAHATHGGDEADERWVCPGCRAAYTERDYRTKVDAVYVLHAEALTASQLREVYRVAEGTVRQWANRGLVRKRGRDQSGRMLYDVADTLAARDRGDQQSA